MLKLFYSPNACSLAPHSAVEEAGADYQAVRVDFASGEQRSERYLALNPKGRVPVLVTDQGPLTEVAVILGWIAQSYPAAKLKPEGDFFAFSKMQEFNLYIASTVHVAFAHLFRGERWADSPEAIANMKAKVPSNMTALLGLIEDRFADGRTWVMGEQYTVSDPYLYVMTRWLEREGAGGSAHLPRLVAHRSRVQARPAAQKALADEGLNPV